MCGATITLFNELALSAVTAPSAHSISIAMFDSGTVFNSIFKFRKYFEPPGYLVGGFFPST